MLKTTLAIAALTLLASGNAEAVLVTYYNFSGNPLDSSGFANNGTVHGATLTADRFGNPNSAYQFNGLNNYIDASAAGLPTGERTVMFWFKADSVNTRPVFLGYGGGSCGTSFFAGLNAAPAQYNNGYYVTAHCDINSLTYTYPSAPTGVWTNFAATTSAAGTKLYVNGVLVASNTTFVNNTNVAGKALAMGVDVSPAGLAPYTDVNVGYFAGALDEVRIYNTALTAGEIIVVSGVPEPNPGLMLLIGVSALELLRRHRNRAIQASPGDA